MYKIVLYSDERNLLEPIVEVFKEYLPRCLQKKIL